jgi:hypothetical protein
LRDYAPTNTGGAVGGWFGQGRQRATFAAPGPITRDNHGDAPLWVTVHVLVTPYEPGPGARREAPAPRARADELASRPSSAPTPDAPGWRALDSEWIQLAVPVRRLDSGRLVIGAAHDPDVTDQTGTDSSAPDLKGA